MRLLALLCMLCMIGCASTGPTITKKTDGSVVFENRSYTLGPAQLTGASNDFDGAYEVRPDGTVVIMIKSGQAIEQASSQSPISDVTELVKEIKAPWQ